MNLPLYVEQLVGKFRDRKRNSSNDCVLQVVQAVQFTRRDFAAHVQAHM